MSIGVTGSTGINGIIGPTGINGVTGPTGQAMTVEVLVVHLRL